MKRGSVWLVCVMLLGGSPGAAQSIDLDLPQLVEEGVLVGLLAQEQRVFDLTLDDAIERALARNLDIAVERLNPQVQDLSVAQANSAYLPNFSSSFDVSRRTSPSRSQLDGANPH